MLGFDVPGHGFALQEMMNTVVEKVPAENQPSKRVGDFHKYSVRTTRNPRVGFTPGRERCLIYDKTEKSKKRGSQPWQHFPGKLADVSEFQTAIDLSVAG
jgi:hypothetical protein